jgi:thioredoxin-like negative regulator of GroEL
VVEEAASNMSRAFDLLTTAHALDPLNPRNVIALSLAQLNRGRSEDAQALLDKLLIKPLTEEIRKDIILLKLRIQLGWV